MFASVQLRKFITFIVGLLFGGVFVSIAVIGIASLFGTRAESSINSLSLDTSTEVGVSMESSDDLQAGVEQFLDSIANSAQQESRFTRKATLYSILMRANVRLLVVFFEDSQSVSNNVWRQEIQTAILRRLTMIDPGKALDLALTLPIEQRPNLIESVFYEWSLLNLDGAVRAGSRLDFPNREFALGAMMLATVDLHTEERIEIGQSFGYEKFARRLIETSTAMELIDTPRSAWEVLIGDGLDVRFRLDSVVDVARTWVSEDGVGVLSEILELGGDLRGSSAINLLLIRSIARANPEEIFRQATLEPDLQPLLYELASVWAETSPIDALKGVAVIDDVSRRWSLTRGIMRSWSERNPHDLLEKIAVLPDTMELQAISSAIRTIAKTDPREAVRLIENFRTEGVNTWPVAESLVFAWVEIDPGATLEWVVSGSNDDNPRFGRLVEIALTRLAIEEPERALDLALNPPSSAWPTWLDRVVIREFAREDVDAAAKFLPRVSDRSRVGAYTGVGFEYVQSGNPEGALELAQQLRQPEKDKYYSSIFDSWATIDPHQLLEAMEEIPSNNARSLAAKALIYRNEERHFFSEDQVKRVKTYLNKEDAE
ncbi:MAG: hypothetical protein F4Z87_02370 [Gammaproteobacteria bacterium]|nr:hypothetical protein [Gammaproteobacteria bacterium]